MTFEMSYNIRKRNDDWIVLLHGLQSCKKIYNQFLSDKRFDSYSCVAFDYVGFGDSEKPEDFDYKLSSQRDSIVSMLDSLEIVDFHIIGHSIGGMIGTMLIERLGDRVESLVSMEGNLISEDSTHSHLVYDKTPEEASQIYQDVRKKMKDDLKNSGPLRYEWTRDTPDYVFHRTAKSVVDESKDGHLLEVFEESPQRKLLILGEWGTYKSRPKGSQNRIVTVPNSGHFMITDNPSFTLDQMDNFLREL